MAVDMAVHMVGVAQVVHTVEVVLVAVLDLEDHVLVGHPNLEDHLNQVVRLNLVAQPNLAIHDLGDANNSSTEESKDGTEAEKQTASTSSTTVTKTVTKQGSQLSIWELLLYGVLYFGGMVAVFWILAWILKKVLDV